MKTTIHLLFSLLFSLSLFAQQNKVILESSNNDVNTLVFKLESYSFRDVQTPKGMAKVIQAGDLSPMLIAGAPDLPKFTASLAIPDLGDMKVKVTYTEYEDIENILIAPSKGNLTRNIDPSTIPYHYGEVYQTDRLYPSALTSLDEPYIMRDIRGQALHVFPFRYNPVTRTLRVYSTVKVEVFPGDRPGKNQLYRHGGLPKISKEFGKIYRHHFINYSAFQSRYTPLEEEGSMLIICYDDWVDEMQSFVNWKNTIGRPTTIVPVSVAGSTAAQIKSFVTDVYNSDESLTYLLLVGDAEQIPTNSGEGLGGNSDNAYAYITGDDHYLEFFVGRFSAENAQHVATQVQRTIAYELGENMDNNWLNKLMSVGSDQGPGDDNELDFEHLRNIQTDLLGFTYASPPNELFDGSQGGSDDIGNPNAIDVAAVLNNGVGITNYTGHGADTYWGTSGFSVDDVFNLQNKNKLPFIWDVACVNGNFVGQTCFGEAWLRAEQDGEPTGAVAIIASTINQSWNPPMIGQDEMNDLLVGASANGIKRTFGGLSVNGMFQMIDESGDFDMIDTWTCFGDPSLYVRTDNPVEMAVTHDPTIISGTTQFTVNCDTEGALATLSLNGQFIGSAVVTSGIADIPVSGIVPGEEYTLAVVAFNKVTYLTGINSVSPTGSYLIVNEYVDQIDFGQTKNIDMSLKNIGSDDAENVNASVYTNDAGASFTNTSYSYGDIDAGDTSAMSNGAFTLTVADDLPDQQIIYMNVEMSDNSGSWTQIKPITVNAPAFEIDEMLIVDDSSGNNNGVLDSGETADLLISVQNTGHADISNVIGHLSSNNPDITLNNTVTSPQISIVGNNLEFVFNVSVDTSVNIDTPVDFQFDLTAGDNDQYTAGHEFNLIIGFAPEYCEANSGNTGYEFISNVSFVDIENPSDVADFGYSDFTDISTDIVRGESYPITITNGQHWEGDAMGCWIDWNHDGDFEDEGESIPIDYIGPDGIGTVDVPSNAFIGTLTMRVRVVYNEEPLPCGTSEYGEVEDYSVNVLDQNNAVTETSVNTIDIYPNPADAYFLIRTDKATSLHVFDLTGKELHRIDVPEGSTSLDISGWNTGIYVIKAVTNDGQSGVKTYRLIVE